MVTRVHKTLVVFLTSGLMIAGCGGTESCVDSDGDGFGPGCALGEDCDENNALRTNNCDRVDPPDCTVDPFLTGCACAPGQTQSCFPATSAGEPGVGACRAGFAFCQNGFWGLCDGPVVSRPELCNDVDDDCDGTIDEDVVSPCGACAPGCIGGVWGEGDTPFDVEEPLEVTPGGGLTLARSLELSSFVYVANSGEGTLSKIDPRVAMEVARYSTGGTEPSRVAVDYLGDVFVLNREFGGVSSVTKIAGEEARCVDRDDDGEISTSSGPDVVTDDECVLFTRPVGERGGVARAIAIDGNRGLDDAGGGDPWVGLHDGETIVHLSGGTGEELERVATPDFAPYAAAFDPLGTLYMISREGELLSLDRRARPLAPTVKEVPLACFLTYGLDVDLDGRVVMSGFSCDRVTTYDPLTERFRSIESPGSPRGLAIAEPFFYTAHTDGRLSRISIDPLEVLNTVSLESVVRPTESIGVGVDAFGDVWIASSVTGDEAIRNGVATRVDGETLEVTAQVPVGLAPHTQGDLSGAKLSGGYFERGVTTQVFSGCGAMTDWRRVHLAAVFGVGSSVLIEARHAASEAALTGDFTRIGVAPEGDSPFPLSFPMGGVLEVRLTLETEAFDGAPLIDRVGVEWLCGGPE